MATLVEDIIKALKNLGGQASLNQIYAEVGRIRIDPLPTSWQANVRGGLEAHSSDSHVFKGKDFFRKVEKGIWALRDYPQKVPNTQGISEKTNPTFLDYSPPQTFEKISKESKMEKNELIRDTGLFVGQKLFEFSLTESFESLTSLLQTIKEYREFANPDQAAAWFEYIHQFFQILGFNTVKVAPRLITLQEMGANQTPKALVCIVGPQEDFGQIIFGLGWESYLFYAAKYLQVEWVILTNGLQFKVLNYANEADLQKYFKCELDEIIKNSKLDSFFTLYKIFSVINRGKEAKPSKQQGAAKKPSEKGEKVLAERHHLRKEFWTQLLARSKSKTELFARRNPGNDSFLGIGGGKSGISYNYNITREDSRIELYIDRGDAIWNKNTFDYLFMNKPEIEMVFGTPLIWERLDEKRASIVRFRMNQYGLRDKEKWPELQDQMIEAMIRFENAFRPFISRLV